MGAVTVIDIRIIAALFFINICLCILLVIGNNSAICLFVFFFFQLVHIIAVVCRMLLNCMSHPYIALLMAMFANE